MKAIRQSEPPGDFGGDSGIRQFTSFAAHNGPAPPYCAQTLPIARRLNFVSAVAGDQDPAVLQFNEGDERRVDLFDGIGKAS